MTSGTHVQHPLLRDGAVEFRGYQANLARIAGKHDTLVVLPTGLGKTVIATLALADALRGGATRALILAPTKPLVEQHAASLRGLLAPPWPERVQALTGTQSPDKRQAVYGGDGGLILAATPQVIHNDVVGGRLDLASFQWVVFDEAHRAVGDYPYAFLGRELQRKAPGTRRLGLTASPGHDVAKIEEVRQNLGLDQVEIRTPADPDVSPYVQTVGVEWETLPLPPAMARASRKLQAALAQRVRALKGLGFLADAGSRPRRRDFLMLGGELQGRLARSADADPALYTALSLQAQALKLQHAIELVETQGSSAFQAFLESLRQEAGGPKPTKASRAVVEDPDVNEAYHVARLDTSDNPKLGRAGALVQQELERSPDARIIVFTHYRSTCDMVARHLSVLPGVRPVQFVGQTSKGEQAGLSQKQQGEVLARFREGTHNVLVATSVAEEGLDIPDTDLVVFFEPIPSEIRSIQRRGRTGRTRAGRVIVLMTEGTQDQAAHWVSRRREAEMVRELQALRLKLAPKQPGPAAGGDMGQSAGGTQSRLDSPDAPPRSEKAAARARPGPASTLAPVAAPDANAPRIIFDSREQAGGVVRHLHELGATLEARTLDTADYVLSDRVAVERKGCADFVDSLVDGRLFEQLRALRSYPRPFLVLEGESLHGHRNVSVEALMGALAAVSVDYGIPVLQVKDALETARFLYAVAKREQNRDGRKMAVRSGKPTANDAEQQIYLLCGLPGISDTLAERLLERFGSAAGVFAAGPAELSKVEGIGPARASEIRRVLDLAWKERRLVLGARNE